MNKQRLGIFWRSLLCGTCLAGLFALPAPLVAQDGWDDEEEEVGMEDAVDMVVSWEESDRKKEMEQKMEAQLRQKRNEYLQMLTSARIASQIPQLARRRIKDPKLGDFSLLRIPGIILDWEKNYNRTPPKSLQDIVEDVAIEAEEEAEAQLRPEEQKRQIRLFAEEHFVMVKLKEKVSLVLRGGHGTSVEIVNQPFNGANDEYVVLGTRQVIKEDLDPDDQARFYPEINAKMKEDYIRNNLGKVDADMASRIDKYIYDNTAKEFRANYYVPDISKPTASLRTAKPEFWIPMKDFVEKVRATYVDRMVEQYKITEFPQWMQQQGYYLVDKEDKTGKEWVDEMEKTRREMPAPSSNGPDGMNGMNGMPGGYPGPGGMPGGYPGPGPR
ncbi:MAG: hypothetical protein ACI4SG_05540 [Oligosphaeraceae bacterium]